MKERRREFRWPWRDAMEIRREVDEEIRFHLDMRAEELKSEGMPEKEARARALHEFGDTHRARRLLRKADQMNENHRRHSEMFSEFAQDLKYAVRTLKRGRAFALTAILTFAVGIAATTVVFSVVDAVLFQSLPFPQPDRLVHISTTGDLGESVLSPPDFIDVRNELAGEARVAAYHFNSVVLTLPSTAERIVAVRATPGFFETLGVTPARGRVFTDQDGVPGQDHVILLSDTLWRNELNADSDIVGKSLRIDGEPFTVAGVMAPGLEYPEGAEAWIPQSFTERELTTQRGAHYLDVIGRLGPGTTLQGVQARLTTLTARLSQQYSNTNANQGAKVVDLRESIVGGFRRSLTVLLTAGLCLLLIACANIAGLTVVRTVDREHELNLRAALGAGRWRVTRTLLAESLVVAAAGCIIGVVVAGWGIGALTAVFSDQVPRISNLHLNGRGAAFAVSVTVVSVLLFGLLPAWRVFRTDRLSNALSEGGRTLTGSGKKAGMQSVLIAGEVAVTLVLLASAGLLARTFFNLQHVDPGFTIGNVLTFSLYLPDSRYPNPQTARVLISELHDRIRALPGVTQTGSVSALPLSNRRYTISISTVDGRRLPPDGADKYVQLRIATPGYFETLGMRLLRGRLLERQDTENSMHAVVITEATAHLLWPGEDALGHAVELGTGLGLGLGRVGGTVVGILADYHEFGVRQPSPPMLFIAHAQFPYSDQVVTIQTAGDPRALVAAVRSELRQLDPELPMASLRDMREVAVQSLAEDRSYLLLVGLYASLALVLAAIGIYGITGYSVAQRRREFGLRIALGASPRRILGTAILRTFKLVTIGVAMGLAGTLMATQALGKMLFALSPTDPATLLAVAVGFLLIAFIASWFPARQAKRIDPMTALREE
jgi:putative ABC transport system permease protein